MQHSVTKVDDGAVFLGAEVNEVIEGRRPKPHIDAEVFAPIQVIGHVAGASRTATAMAIPQIVTTSRPGNDQIAPGRSFSADDVGNIDHKQGN